MVEGTPLAPTPRVLEEEKAGAVTLRKDASVQFAPDINLQDALGLTPNQFEDTVAQVGWSSESVGTGGTQTTFPQYAEGLRAPGDEILLSLQRISDVQGATTKALNDKLNQLGAQNDIPMAELLKLQKLVADYQITQDLITKAADKISQGAQTLFRNQ